MLQKNTYSGSCQIKPFMGVAPNPPGDGCRGFAPPGWDARLVTQGFEQLACRLRRC